MNPEWVDISVVLAIHEQQIAEHVGLLGIRVWEQLCGAWRWCGYDVVYGGRRRGVEH